MRVFNLAVSDGLQAAVHFELLKGKCAAEADRHQYPLKGNPVDITAPVVL